MAIRLGGGVRKGPRCLDPRDTAGKLLLVKKQVVEVKPQKKKKKTQATILKGIIGRNLRFLINK